MTKTVVTLSDRYEQLSGEVFLSSMQALVRLPVDQIRRDRAAGLVTGGYITGYRGSPITTLDAQLWSSKTLLEAHDIHFEPGLNEELAATSLRGSQQHNWFGASKYQGVFGMWYGKGLGVDRACEALKLANFEGTSPYGGVLVVAGDDHAAKSSASAHQSEHTLIVGFIPILAPSTTDEILLYGQLGFEMSRFSGLYIGLKTVTDTLDLTSSVKLPEINVVRPNLSGTPDLNIRRIFAPLQVESLVVNERLPAALLFARANGLNRVVIGGEKKSLAIVTAGKPYLDVRQAMRDLGLDEARCRKLGISLIKFGMTWPLDPEFARTACAGHRELLVVEEKRPVIEEQLAVALYGLTGDRPAITGKRDDKGQTLFPLDNVIDPGMTRRVLVARLEAHGLVDDEIRRRADELAAIDAVATSPVVAIRPAFFCSGCPHNTSTVVPDGSFALGATGCHGLAVFMPERRTLPVVGMGAEGMPWLAGQHFSEAKHAFQNLGDGTYNHSGILSVRASVAAKSNVTFKVLYNDAVAMTGGQPIEGGLTVDTILKELLAEKVEPVVLVTDDPDKFEGKLPAGVKLYHRDELDKVQRELREIPGTSGIVYEQTCANEKRRRRKRGSYPDPDLRLYINPAVCEGCGDCSVQSNCMSVQPLETEFGRKRQIDQSNCNKDYSCIKGYCPSFVSLRGAKPAKRALDTAGLQPLVAKLSEPAVVDVSDSYSMLMTGIGGTGVLTVGAILGTAAHMEGKRAKVLDMTGMAQKGGGVMSHVRFSNDVEKIPSSRLGAGQTDLLIAYDLIVASGPEVTKTVRADTRVIANEDVAPTGEFQTKADLDLGANRFLPAIEQRVKQGNIALIRANELAQKLMGDTIFTNLMMVGFAAQKGLLPVELDSIEEAVRLNGNAVNANLQALTLGRIAAEFPHELLKFAGLNEDISVYPQTLDALLASRSQHLTNYQDEAYAQRYREFVSQVEAKLKARGVANAEPFLMQVANQLARLMAYKDEYEVARLYSSPAFRESLKEQFDGDFKIGINLGSPILALGRRDAKTGRPKKVELGAWILPLFGLLTKFKGLRGGPLDLFGYQGERKMERRLIGEYQEMILKLADGVTDRTIGIATEIAGAAAEIKGYGPIKEAGVETWHATVARLMADYQNPPEEAAPTKAKGERVTALASYRILELSEGVAGEYCGKLLSDFGASLIKIERPDGGSPTRHMSPFGPGDVAGETSGFFAFLNTNKHSVALDIASDDGKRLLAGLLDKVDVVIDDHASGWLKEVGLDPETVEERWPGLVLCSITAFGQNPPDDRKHAEDLTVFHASGWGYHTPGAGYDDLPPLKGPGRFLVSYESGMDAAMCVTAALYEREELKRGQFIDISKHAVMVSRCDYVVALLIANELDVGESRGIYDLAGPGGIFPCRDGYIYVFVSTRQHWKAWCKLIGRPEWLQEFPELWLEKVEELTPERTAKARAGLVEWLSTRDKNDAAAEAQALGITLVPINNTSETLENPQIRHRQYYAEVEHPVLGKALYPTVPYKMSETPAKIASPAPALGQDSVEALA